MRRHNVTYRMRTQVAQKIPEDAPKIVDEFLYWIQEQIHGRSLPASLVVNYDETPVWFDQPSTRVHFNLSFQAILLIPTQFYTIRFEADTR
jgi:hypothetical protein